MLTLIIGQDFGSCRSDYLDDVTVVQVQFPIVVVVTVWVAVKLDARFELPFESGMGMPAVAFEAPSNDCEEVAQRISLFHCESQQSDVTDYTKHRRFLLSFRELKSRMNRVLKALAQSHISAVQFRRG